MASNKKRKGSNGVPWTWVVPVAHVVIDLATRARCPACGDQVILYVCFNCKKIVRPQRGQAAA